MLQRRRFRADTEAARSLAELGGYLVDKRELVTLMTLGAMPELLVLGYLLLAGRRDAP